MRNVSKGKKFRLIFGTTILIILLVFIGVKLWASRNASAVWFDTGYGFRKKIPITNSSGSTQTDFQLQATIDTATLITAGKMQSDCDDVRFTDINGKVLPYFLEAGTCNTASTLVWFKASSIDSNGTDVYFYYGNPTATSSSSATKTFIRDIAQAAATWPLDDTTTTQSYSRATNPSLSTGYMNIVLNSQPTSSSSWTLNANWAFSNNLFTHTSGSTATITQSSIGLVGKAYSVTYTVSGMTTGTITVSLGASGAARSTNGTFTENIVSTSTTLTFTPSSTFDGSISNFSVYEINIPGSSATLTQLLTDGDMETSGTASWTAGNSAVLSKQSTNPHGGSQLIRVAYNGVTNPNALQTILTSGQVYRATGYMRSDGTALPRIVENAVVLFSGTNSTGWQSFDVTFVATGTTFRLQAGTSTSSTYAEFDDVVVSLDNGIRQGELLQDGNMEVSGTGVWLVANSATLSKQTGSPHGGSQVLRVAYNSGSSDAAYQSILNIGKRYRVQGFARGDGTTAAAPNVRDTTVILFAGTNSNTWQPFDVTFIATTNNLRLLTANDVGYTEWDDVSITEVSPLVGLPTNGVTLGTSSGVTHLSNAYTFDGTNDYVNNYSSSLNSVFNPNEGTLLAWANITSAGVWSDATARYIAYLGADGNNQLYLRKTTTTNQLQAVYESGGNTKSITTTAQGATTNWVQVVLTWSKSNDQVKFYVNGAQVSTTSMGLVSWTGNLSSSIVGIGSNGGGSNPWKGMINDVRVYSRALSASEISDQYNASYDIQNYTTGNYSGHELIRKYNTSVTLGSLASEEVGPGPIAFWAMDEGQGQTVHDGTSNNNSATLGADLSSGSDDPTWQNEDQCVSSKCLKFDGSNDLVNVSNTVNGVKSVGFWINPISTTASIVNLTGSAYITVASGTISATGFISPTIYVNGAITSTFIANTWQYVEVTTSTAINANAITIGKANGAFANAFIDEVKFYQYVRSSAQVTVDYNSGAEKLGKVQQRNFLSNGLVGYWKMDETSWTNDCSTGTVVDSSGNGNNAKSCPNSTGPTGGSTTAKFGNAGSFDGSDDYLETASNLFDPSTTDFTLSAWVRSTSIATNQVIFSQQDGTGTGRTWLQLLSSKLQTGLGGAGGLSGNTTLSSNSYYLATLTKAGTTVSIYLNGVLDGSTTLTSESATGVQRIGISKAATSPFIGQIDEARMYKRALSPSEIALLYNWAPGPVGYWNFDEKTGTTAKDTSGNNNTGTLTSSPTWTTGKYGSSVNLSPTNSYVSVADNSSLNITGDITVEAWVKPSAVDSTSRVFLEKGDGSTTANRQYGLRLSSSNTWTFFLYTGSTTNSIGDANTTPSTSRWDHVVGVRSGNNIYIYTNGVLQHAAVAITGSTNSSSNILAIGRTGSLSSGYFGGNVDEVKIYNYARTQSQILEDMNGGQAGAVSGGSVGALSKPIAYYALDEQQGQTVNNSGLSGSSLNGTLGANSSPASDDPTWKTKESCKINGCLSFDGGDFVNITNGPATFGSNSQGAISLWFSRSSAGTNQSLFYTGASGTSNNLFSMMFTSSNTLQVLLKGASSDIYRFTVDLGATASNGSWNHIVFTDTSSGNTFYYNGKPLTLTYTSGNATTDGWFDDIASEDKMYIGARDVSGLGNYFGGYIDEVKIYNTALTADQVKLDMNNSSSVAYSVLGASEMSTLSDGAGNPPIDYLNFDEKTGTTANDISGNSMTGSINAGTYVPGKIGSGVSFNGSSSYVSITDSNSFNTAGTTYEMWVKLNQTASSKGSDQTIAIHANSISPFRSFWFYQASSDNTLGAYIYNQAGTGVFMSGPALTTNTWYHLVLTWDLTTAKLYINGALYANSSLSGTTVFDANQNFCLGSNNCVADYLNGVIDEFKVYDYARTQAQVAYDYNRGFPVGWWQFDQCQGTIAYDNSGNGNNGTITIGTAGGTGHIDSVGTCNTASTAWGNGVSGKFNSSLSFDGIDDYVDKSSPSAAVLLGTLNEYTISAWFKTTSSTNDLVVYSETNSSTNTPIVLIYVNRNTIGGVGTFKRDDSGTTDDFTGGANLGANDGQWHQFTATRKGAIMSVYFDGKFIRSTTGTAGNATTNRISIGAQGRTSGLLNYFPGQIDDVRIYNYALSTTQVQQVYNGGAEVRFGPTTGQP